MEIDDAEDVASHFSMVWGFHAAEKKFTLLPNTVVFTNQIFERLRGLNTSVGALVADETDYWAMLKDAKDEDAKDYAISMISAKRLAKSDNKNLDDMFKVMGISTAREALLAELMLDVDGLIERGEALDAALVGSYWQAA